MRCLKIITAAVVATFALPIPSADAAALGVASDYNVFVIGNSNRSNSDSLGAYAVGGNATFSSFGVASNLTFGTGLVVGGGLTFTQGSIKGGTIVGGNATLNNPTFGTTLDVGGNVDHSNWGGFNGNVTIGGYLNSAGFSTNNNSAKLRVGGNLTSTNSLSVNGGVDVGGNASISTPTISNGLRANGSVLLSGGGSVSPGVTYGTTYSGPSYISRSQQSNSAVVPAPAAVPIDFTAAKTTLEQSSSFWGNLTANGTHNLSFSTRTLTGVDNTLNIFNLTAADFNNVSTFNINVPAGSTVLVNVTGTSVTLPNIGYTLNGAALGSQTSGADFGKLLWNLPNAMSLTLNSLGGSVLAPLADTTFNSAQLNGTLITLNLSGTGESHDYPFIGALPPANYGNQGIPEPTALGLLAHLATLLLRRR